jgi:hypothetical protein
MTKSGRREYVDKVIQRLPQGKWVGREYRAPCPAHGGDGLNLTVNAGDDGRALLKCWSSGCSYQAIAEALGFQSHELMPANTEQLHQANHNGKVKAKTVHPTFERAAQAAAWSLNQNHSGASLRHTGTWSYRNRRGSEYARVLRFDTDDGEIKDYRPVHINGGGWSLGDPPGGWLPYRVNELPEQGDIWLVEGEKAADALWAHDIPATTSAHGCKAPHKTNWATLASRQVVAWPDNHEAGRSYIDKVAQLLAKLDKPASVQVIDPPAGIPNGGDAVDYIDAGHDAEAIVSLAENAKPVTPTASGDAGESSAPGAILTRLADVQPESIRWLWPQRIALGKLTLIAGDPGLGKSFLTLDLASRVSTGKGWPDDPATTYQPGDVVLLSAEDDLQDTIRPRLDAAGADVNCISAIEAVRDLDGQGNPTERMPDLSRDVRHVEAELAKLPDPRLVVIDPISAYMGNVDSHKNADVRGALAPLSQLASKHELAVVAVTHLRKGEGQAIHRTMGSLAYVAAARAAWAVTRDENDEARRLFVPIKNNLGNDRQGFAFKLDDTGRQAPAVSWEAEPVDMTADDAIGEASKPGPEPKAREQAEQWLREQLADGPRPMKELEEQAEADGHSKGTLKRARREMPIESYQMEVPGPWYWRLADGQAPAAQDDPGP